MLPRFELTGSTVAIKTTDNELMKQGRGKPEEEGYELVASPPRGPPVANVKGMYEVPSVPPNRDQLPAVPPPASRAGDEEGVYEIIPGDK